MNWKEIAKANKKQHAQTLQKLTRAKKPEKIMQAVHDEVFSKIDCLECANCCKTISPRFNNTDIARIAKHLKISETNLIQQYLLYDADGDYVVNRLPCPFLLENNDCDIYSVRPKDCKNYPYTDNDIFFTQTNLTAKNAHSCPAVVSALEILNTVL